MTILTEANKSFIFIKPDIIQKSNIINEIYNQISLSNLSIEDEFEVALNASDVDYMWPQCHEDFVTNSMLKLYLTQHRIPVLILSGNNAIEKTSQIKKTIRRNFALFRYSNCIHTPSSNEEYKKHINCINKITNTENYICNQNSKINMALPFKRFSNLDQSSLTACANNLWNQIKTVGWEKIINSYNTKALEHCLFLLNDDKNNIDYVVSLLFDYFADWNLELVYLSVMAAESLGKFLILTSDNYESVKSAYDYLTQKNLLLEYY